MSRVFVSVSSTLDGFIAPAGTGLTEPEDPRFQTWISQWMELQAWVFGQARRLRG